MSQADTFEIHYSREPGRWNLTDVLFDAEAAMAQARTIAAEPGVAAVRVVSSRFDPALDAFRERTIYTQGAEGEASEAGDAGIGCRSGRDLHRRAARRAIQRVLAAELERRHITVLELLHEHGHARAIADTGTVMQAAVQRYAIESAAPGSVVSERVKRLYAVIEEAIGLARDLARQPDRPTLADTGLGQLVEAWPERKLVFSVLAWYLRPAKNWTEKLVLLARALPAQPQAAELGFVDAVAEEVLGARGGLAAIIGTEPRGGAAVTALLALALRGTADSVTPAAAGLLQAAGGIERLPLLRDALAGRARRIVDMVGSLGDGSVVDEFRWLDAAWQIVRAAPRDGPAARLPPALERRAERYTSAERLGALLTEIREPWRQVEQLLQLEPMVSGERARRVLGKYLRQILTGHAAPPGLEAAGEGNPSAQLRRFARWQRQLLTCRLPAPVREVLATLVDDQAVRLLRERQLLNGIAARVPEPWRQVLALIDLVQTEHFTRGQASRLAREFILQRLQMPGVVGALRQAAESDPTVASKGRAMRDFLAAPQAERAA